MLLEQIERKHQKMQEEMTQTQSDKAAQKAKRAAKRATQDPQDPNRDKTIGVKVPPDLYAKLMRIKKLVGLPSVKATLLYVVTKGIGPALDGE